MKHFISCPLCEATCGLEVSIEAGVVHSIRGDGADPFSRGYLCPKAAALKDIHEDPDRLRRPVRREGARWREVGWDEAFDLVARGLRDVRRDHGRDAVAVYLGNPNVHSLGAMLFAPAFARALGSRHRYSATSVDQLPHHLVAFLMFGHPLLLPIPDVDRTGFLLVLGANPLASNGSLMTAPDVRRRLLGIRARGGRVVVVDPRRTETAALADAHLAIRPGTDAALLLALLHTIFGEGLDRPGRLAAHADHLDRLRGLSLPWTPERAAGVTGLDAGAIRALASGFARADRAVCYGRLGVSTQTFGSLACWLVSALNLVTGRIDAEGGAMFTRPAVDLVGGGLVGRGSLGRRHTRVRGLPGFGGELPVAALAEEIDTPGAGQVRALVTVAGNPVLSTPNGGRLDRALASLPFMAAVDFHVNETTRHAHVILPPTGPLERDHYDLVFNALAVRNVAKFSPAVFPRGADQRHDWEILGALTARLVEGPWWQRARARATTAVALRLGPRRLLDVALRRGPYGAGLRPRGHGLRLRTLVEAAHGLDLGPLEPCLPGRLPTSPRRIDAAPEALAGEVDRFAHWVSAREGSASANLTVIGRRDLRSNNSWMHNHARLMKGPDRCTLLMHPDDAATRGLCDGARVRVTSRTGAIDVPLRVSRDVRPGVVSLPHGWGHGREGVRLRVASAQPGASLNDVTDELEVDGPSGNAAFNGVEVKVEPTVEEPGTHGPSPLA